MAGMPGRHLLSRMLGLRRWRCARPQLGPWGVLDTRYFHLGIFKKKNLRNVLEVPGNVQTTNDSHDNSGYKANYNLNHGSARDGRELERTVALIAD